LKTKCEEFINVGYITLKCDTGIEATPFPSKDLGLITTTCLTKHTYSKTFLKSVPFLIFISNFLELENMGFK
jgi:hypothetical protein